MIDPLTNAVCISAPAPRSLIITTVSQHKQSLWAGRQLRLCLTQFLPTLDFSSVSDSRMLQSDLEQPKATPGESMSDDYKRFPPVFPLVNRPGVAGAVLQTPPSFIDLVSQSSFVEISSKHFQSQTVLS